MLFWQILGYFGCSVVTLVMFVVPLILLLFYLFIFFAENKEMAILLDLLFEEICLQPELSSLPCFRIKGGGPLSVTD